MTTTATALDSFKQKYEADNYQEKYKEEGADFRGSGSFERLEVWGKSCLHRQQGSVTAEAYDNSDEEKELLCWRAVSSCIQSKPSLRMTLSFFFILLKLANLHILFS